MQRRWVYCPVDEGASRALAARLACSPILAQCLLNRGIADAGAARAFLRPALVRLHAPELLEGVRQAAQRLRGALERGERVLVYGDYDVDGITGTALLVRLLRLLGAQVEAGVPDRLREGYGLRPAQVAAAAARGVRLIVTVDNGTTAFAAAERAAALGVDLIITDHHEPRPRSAAGRSPVAAGEPTPALSRGDLRLPRCLALLNPKLPEAGYPFPGLAGCGVAFKLAWALAGEVSPGARVRPELREFLLDAMALVAIGTVADAVPLLDENRILVHYGLRALAASPHPGLRALLRVARLEHGVPSAEDVAFQLAPRLNAAGRMGRAELALELLSCEEEQRAAQLAEALDAENRRRRALEREVLAQALDGAERALAQTDGAAIVSAAPGWHPGVIGIVASRLVERYHRPAVLIALDEQGLGRGSARSIPGVRLHAALARCEDLLLRHGGHAQAAGLEIRAERVEPFRRRLGEALAEELASALAAPDGPAPLQVDLELPLGTISETLVRELECLGPHGLANRPPLFSASGLRLAAPPRAVGGGEHLQLSLAQGGTVRRAIGFRLAGKLPELERGGALCAAFRPTLSRYGGGTRVELELADLCPACPPG